jgi:hypothetical protein
MEGRYYHPLSVYFRERCKFVPAAGDAQYIETKLCWNPLIFRVVFEQIIIEKL